MTCESSYPLLFFLFFKLTIRQENKLTCFIAKHDIGIGASGRMCL